MIIKRFIDKIWYGKTVHKGSHGNKVLRVSKISLNEKIALVLLVIVLIWLVINMIIVEF